MKRYRWLEMAAVVTASAAALTAMIAGCVMDRAEPKICPSDLVCAPRWLCADEGQGCHPATCGDHYLDWANGEVCDDGNTVSGDGCSATCLSRETCGDGKVDPGEECDPTDDETGAGCTINCRRMPMCGNGTKDAGEECDDGIDGTRRATADCDEDCTKPICGDRVVNEHAIHEATRRPEECDDGGRNTATCDADCTFAVCGDDVKNAAAGEECDDGNARNDDGCVQDCRLPRCGDGYIWQDGETPEKCDDGNHSNDDGCVQGCKLAACRDGYLWLGVEACEAEADSETCDAHDCTTPVCGDGHINRAAGEACDDGNHESDDDCPSGIGGTCQPAACGDGLVHSDEECDDGNHFDFDDCPSGEGREGPRCQWAICGDHFIRSGVETCDNGLEDTVTCNGAGAPAAAECREPYCGDGHVNAKIGEECERDTDCHAGGAIDCFLTGLKACQCDE
ncbi:MAG TPA: DUF4215 domain-containing protein [Haliangium sp.]|nr:DUF4215 domain-containing protein [Haliangium sp.]